MLHGKSLLKSAMLGLSLTNCYAGLSAYGDEPLSDSEDIEDMPSAAEGSTAALRSSGNNSMKTNPNVRAFTVDG